MQTLQKHLCKIRRLKHSKQLSTQMLQKGIRYILELNSSIQTYIKEVIEHKYNKGPKYQQRVCKNAQDTNKFGLSLEYIQPLTPKHPLHSVLLGLGNTVFSSEFPPA